MTQSTFFCTIQEAIDDASTVDGDVIEISPGTYNEQVVVDKELTLRGVGASKPIIDYTGVPVGKTTLVDVVSDNVTIENIQFEVDLTNLHSAIIASATDLDNITIDGNMINPYHSTPMTYLGGYGSRNAISINYAGFRVASGGVDNITVTNNMVSATFVPPFLGDADDIAFRSAVSVDEGGGTYTGNTFQTINHDVLVRFNSNGNVLIDNNTFNGGGVQLSDHNAGAGTYMVTNNTFDGSGSGSVMRLQNNQQQKMTTVSGNTFMNLRWGMSVENYGDLTIDNNSFSALAGEPGFTFIALNTKSISSNSNTIVQTEVNGTITNNTFTSLGTGVGTAISFHNHDSDAAVLGNYMIGGVGNENTFNPGFEYMVKLDDQTGPSDGSVFPPYGAGGGWTTTMACWAPDQNIINNLFDVGTGAKSAGAMTGAERTLLEGDACMTEKTMLVWVS